MSTDPGLLREFIRFQHENPNLGDDDLLELFELQVSKKRDESSSVARAQVRVAADANCTTPKPQRISTSACSTQHSVTGSSQTYAPPTPSISSPPSTSATTVDVDSFSAGARPPSPPPSSYWDGSQPLYLAADSITNGNSHSNDNDLDNGDTIDPSFLSFPFGDIDALTFFDFASRGGMEPPPPQHLPTSHCPAGHSATGFGAGLGSFPEAKPPSMRGFPPTTGHTSRDPGAVSPLGSVHLQVYGARQEVLYQANKPSDIAVMPGLSGGGRAGALASGRGDGAGVGGSGAGATEEAGGADSDTATESAWPKKPHGKTFSLNPPLPTSTTTAATATASTITTTTTTAAKKPPKERDGHPQNRKRSSWPKAGTPPTGEPLLPGRRGNRGNTGPAPQRTRYIRPQHPRIMCDICTNVPRGFRGEHEYRRHYERLHAKKKLGWRIRDRSEEGILSKCKACKTGKTYGANYNATAHLRRQHFDPNKFPNVTPPSNPLDWIEEVELEERLPKRGAGAKKSTAAATAAEPSALGQGDERGNDEEESEEEDGDEEPEEEEDEEDEESGWLNQRSRHKRKWLDTTVPTAGEREDTLPPTMMHYFDDHQRATKRRAKDLALETFNMVAPGFSLPWAGETNFSQFNTVAAHPSGQHVSQQVTRRDVHSISNSGTSSLLDGAPLDLCGFTFTQIHSLPAELDQSFDTTGGVRMSEVQKFAEGFGKSYS